MTRILNLNDGLSKDLFFRLETQVFMFVICVLNLSDTFSKDLSIGLETWRHCDPLFGFKR